MATASHVVKNPRGTPPHDFTRDQGALAIFDRRAKEVVAIPPALLLMNERLLERGGDTALFWLDDPRTKVPYRTLDARGFFVIGTQELRNIFLAAGYPGWHHFASGSPFMYVGLRAYGHPIITKDGELRVTLPNEATEKFFASKENPHARPYGMSGSTLWNVTPNEWTDAEWSASKVLRVIGIAHSVYEEGPHIRATTMDALLDGLEATLGQDSLLHVREAQRIGQLRQAITELRRNPLRRQ